MVSRTARITYFVLFVIALVSAGIFRNVHAPELCAVANDIFW
jgi:hypothetical protein